MVFERPPKPGQANLNRATQRPSKPGQKKKVITTGGKRGDSGKPGRNSRGGNRGGGGGSRDRRNDEPLPPETSPWLIDPEFEPNASASFVEYLRWMRSPDSLYKDPTKVQILQIAEENADYRDRLKELNQRTKLIAGEANCFNVTCPWRIRVGGHRGPESILLPAFDALGMPYVPSSTLRGVARTQAIREKLAADLDYSNKEAVKKAWKEADRQVAEWFGHLDAEGSDRTGKVIFLDAYPVANDEDKSGGLAVDMANSIWSWKDNTPEYDPNPNPYFSLAESTFVIGIRRTAACSQEQFEQVKRWLTAGLTAGIGSQVNSGYGSLLSINIPDTSFFQVDFTLQGQLIHGRQRFENVHEPYERKRESGQFKRAKGKLKPKTESVAEIRPIALKSMLRYWFRVFALGVMRPQDVKVWEAKLFGAIDPQTHGWVRVTLSNIEKIRPEAKYRGDDCGEYTATLNLTYSSEAPVQHYDAISNLFEYLTWLMFHLGSVGQGARRPCYSRSSKPYWRGAELFSDRSDLFWQCPNEIQAAKTKFQAQIQSFHNCLNALLSTENTSSSFPKLLSAGNVTPHSWVDAADKKCRILIVSGAENTKPYALDILHDQFHQLEDEAEHLKKDSEQLKSNNLQESGRKFGQYKAKKSEAKSLCGGANKDKIRIGSEWKDRGAIPSPIWIKDLGNYQVVTVFGATQNPRKKYLDSLQDAVQIFPLT
ncbi:MAG: type III-B CRISPR module RAMP protein Cmr6 [Leptolyngbya sp. SIOISBB]|nr:type III-B CRISPR module RAMP protein Cmr6 [Leptolyngbya sp. SIOISBB]